MVLLRCGAALADKKDFSFASTRLAAALRPGSLPGVPVFSPLPNGSWPGMGSGSLGEAGRGLGSQERFRGTCALAPLVLLGLQNPGTTLAAGDRCEESGFLGLWAESPGNPAAVSVAFRASLGGGDPAGSLIRPGRLEAALATGPSELFPGLGTLGKAEKGTC